MNFPTGFGGGDVDGTVATCFFPGGGLAGGAWVVFFTGPWALVESDLFAIGIDVVCVFICCGLDDVNEDVAVGLCWTFTAGVDGVEDDSDVLLVPEFFTNGELLTILLDLVCLRFVVEFDDDDDEEEVVVDVDDDVTGFAVDVVTFEEEEEEEDNEEVDEEEDFENIEGFDIFGFEVVVEEEEELFVEEEDENIEDFEDFAGFVEEEEEEEEEDDEDEDGEGDEEERPLEGEVDDEPPSLGAGLVLSECFPCFLLLSFKKFFIFPIEFDIAELILPPADDDDDDEDPFTSMISAIVSDL